MNLRPQQLEQLIAFPEEYSRFGDRKLRSLATGGVETAGYVIRARMKKAKKGKIREP